MKHPHMPLEWMPLNATIMCIPLTSLTYVLALSHFKFGPCNFLACASELVIYLL